ncbi:MAG TPA: hypothetical protein VJ508_06185, partial [Saprospiraceae bacterium]|nr:hypothetical protein [Saprospiraceae bacterium]
MAPAKATTPGLAADQVNLALRRTADKLLRASGDTTSRIPAVELINDHTWRVYVDQDFEYKLLPPILQSSLDLYGIRQTYEVTVRQCETSIIDLGYHQQDFVRDSMVPCMGRDAPPGCHYVEITFSDKVASRSFWAGGGVFLIAIFGLAGFIGLLRLSRKRPSFTDE